MKGGSVDRREDAGEVYPGGGFAPTGGGARPDTIAELAAQVAELAAEVDKKVDETDFGAFDGMVLPDTATQKEVRQMLQQILLKLQSMKGAGE